jgi:hypothetical protein
VPVAGARIIDLMPTWLHCLRQDVPIELEGRVIAELFEQTAPSLARAEPKPVSNAT